MQLNVEVDAKIRSINTQHPIRTLIRVLGGNQEHSLNRLRRINIKRNGFGFLKILIRDKESEREEESCSTGRESGYEVLQERSISTSTIGF
jgi:hypothetical protein